MKKLFFLSIISLLICAFSSDTHPPAPIDSTTYILNASFGGSNAGIYDLDSVTGVRGWNISTLKYEHVLYGKRQFNASQNRYIGFQVALAQKMKVAHSVDSLYFVDYHVLNSAIDTWNVHTGTNFFKFIYQLDMALAAKSQITKINFFFLQGERDCQSSASVSTYKQSEFEIFKYIRDKYDKVLGYDITIINYRLPNALNPAVYPRANRIAINTAKELNLSEGIVDYLIKSDSLVFNADKVTLSRASGIVKFADSIMTKPYR